MGLPVIKYKEELLQGTCALRYTQHLLVHSLKSYRLFLRLSIGKFNGEGRCYNGMIEIGLCWWDEIE